MFRTQKILVGTAYVGFIVYKGTETVAHVREAEVPPPAGSLPGTPTSKGTPGQRTVDFVAPITVEDLRQLAPVLLAVEV